MFRRLSQFVVLAAVAVLALSGTAHAKPVPHKENTNGIINTSELVSDTVALQEFTAEGNATHMGGYTQVGSHYADLTTGEIYDGMFLSVASDGSIGFGTYSGSFTVNEDGTVSYSVIAVWAGGTGRLEGLTGVGVVEALATGAAPGSTFEYTTDGLWNLP